MKQSTQGDPSLVLTYHALTSLVDDAYRTEETDAPSALERDVSTPTSLTASLEDHVLLLSLRRSRTFGAEQQRYGPSGRMP